MLFDGGGFFLLQFMADEQGPQQTEGEHAQPQRELDLVY